MNEDLIRQLEQNKADWLALTLSVGTTERATFTARHDGYFADFGPHFMAHVYRRAIEQVLQRTSPPAREALQEAFAEALHDALEHCVHAPPTTAACQACHHPRLRAIGR